MTDLFAGGEPLPIPLEAQIKCVEREIAMRIAVFGRRVDEGKMNRDKAHAEIAAMRAVLRTLKGIQEAGPHKATVALREIAGWEVFREPLIGTTPDAEWAKAIVERGLAAS